MDWSNLLRCIRTYMIFYYNYVNLIMTHQSKKFARVLFLEHKKTSYKK